MVDEPWRYSRKCRLRSGWAYPIGRDAIRSSLLDAAVRVESLALTMPSPRERPLRVVTVLRYGDLSASGKLLERDPDASILDPVILRVYAIPTEQLSTARDALAAGLLGDALRWIVAARSRGNAWQATERVWRAQLIDAVIRTSEVQRQARGPLLGWTGVKED